MPSTDLVKPDQFRALTASDDTFRAAVAQIQEQDVGEFDLVRIKIPAGGGTTWEIPNVRGGDSTKELQGVILFAKTSRAYWDKPFEGGNEPPICASVDGQHAHARPQPDPENEGQEIMPRIPAQSENGSLLCDTCAYAEFGSGTGRRQACKQMRQVFMLLPGRLLPAVLTLPPTSLKAVKNYTLGLIDEGYAQHGVITKITLEKTKNEGTPEFSVARFSMGEGLDEDQATRAKEYADACRPRFMRVVATAADISPDA